MTAIYIMWRRQLIRFIRKKAAIVGALGQPLFFLSGALFPLENLPRLLSWITKINPLSYGVEGLRYTLTGHAFLSPVVGLIILVIGSLLVIAIGSYQFSKVEV